MSESCALERLAVYTDASVLSHEPSCPAGWCAVFADGKWISGGGIGFKSTDAELMAILAALDAAPPGAPLAIYTDSERALAVMSQLRSGTPAAPDGSLDPVLFHRLQTAVKERDIEVIWHANADEHPLHYFAHLESRAQASLARQRHIVPGTEPGQDPEGAAPEPFTLEQDEAPAPGSLPDAGGRQSGSAAADASASAASAAGAPGAGMSAALPQPSPLQTQLIEQQFRALPRRHCTYILIPARNKAPILTPPRVQVHQAAPAIAVWFFRAGSKYIYKLLVFAYSLEDALLAKGWKGKVWHVAYAVDLKTGAKFVPAEHHLPQPAAEAPGADHPEAIREAALPRGEAAPAPAEPRTGQGAGKTAARTASTGDLYEDDAILQLLQERGYAVSDLARQIADRRRVAALASQPGWRARSPVHLEWTTTFGEAEYTVSLAYDGETGQLIPTSVSVAIAGTAVTLPTAGELPDRSAVCTAEASPSAAVLGRTLYQRLRRALAQTDLGVPPLLPWARCSDDGRLVVLPDSAFLRLTHACFAPQWNALCERLTAAIAGAPATELPFVLRKQGVTVCVEWLTPSGARPDASTGAGSPAEAAATEVLPRAVLESVLPAYAEHLERHLRALAAQGNAAHRSAAPADAGRKPGSADRRSRRRTARTADRPALTVIAGG